MKKTNRYQTKSMQARPTPSDVELSELEARGYELKYPNQWSNDSSEVGKVIEYRGALGWAASVGVSRGYSSIGYYMPDGQHDAQLKTPYERDTDERLDVVLDWLDEAAILVGHMINDLCPR